MAISQRKKGETLTFEDVSKLKYTNKVVEETIRMANIAGFIFWQILKQVPHGGL